MILFFFMYYRFSWTISIVQAWSATKHMIISVVHTPPMPPPWMDYGNYPMFGNLYMMWSFDLPIFVVNYIQCQSSINKKRYLLFSAELVLEPGRPDSQSRAPISQHSSNELSDRFMKALVFNEYLYLDTSSQLEK